jgi:hypothetical protein
VLCCLWVYSIQLFFANWSVNHKSTRGSDLVGHICHKLEHSEPAFLVNQTLISSNITCLPSGGLLNEYQQVGHNPFLAPSLSDPRWTFHAERCLFVYMPAEYPNSGVSQHSFLQGEDKPCWASGWKPPWPSSELKTIYNFSSTTGNFPDPPLSFFWLQTFSYPLASQTSPFPASQAFQHNLSSSTSAVVVPQLLYSRNVVIHGTERVRLSPCVHLLIFCQHASHLCFHQASSYWGESATLPSSLSSHVVCIQAAQNMVVTLFWCIPYRHLIFTQLKPWTLFVSQPQVRTTQSSVSELAISVA